MGYPNQQCKSPLCQKRYHYCSSCGTDRAAELGFCSDACLSYYLKEMNDVPLIVEALLSEYLYGLPDRDEILERNKEQIKDELFNEVLRRN